MVSLLIGLAAGLAATPHCLGMCGGFALHLGRSRGLRVVLVRQFLFLVGKAFTYAFIGALVGALGMYVVQSGWVPGLRKALVFVAAGVTIVLGILMLELPIHVKLPKVRWPGTDLLEEHCPKLMDNRSPLAAFALGLAVGYLPCPLTGLLAVEAATEHSVLKGMALLGGAGIGTMPGLLALGLFGSVVQGRWRKVGTRVLGSIVILLGVAMLLRRLGILPGHHGH